MARCLFLPTAALALHVAGCNCGPAVAVTPEPGDAERYARAVCAYADRCGCVVEAFDDVEACVADRIDAFEEESTFEGIAYDPDCFEQFVSSLEAATNCDPTLASIAVCPIFAGGQGSGEACEPPIGDISFYPVSAFSSCADPLRCVEGRCRAPGGPSNTTEAGGACGYADGSVGCRPDTYCTPAGVCAAQVGLGEACDVPTACANGSETHCAGVRAGVGTCQPRHAIGEGCDPADVQSCAYDLDAVQPGYCDRAGTCRPPWSDACWLVASPPDVYRIPEWVPP